MLAIGNIRKTFNPDTPNQVRALQGVNLALDEGTFVVVIGTNGSGKSTLLNALAGTFIVDEGSIVLDGTDITRWPEHHRAKFIGRHPELQGRAKVGGTGRRSSGVPPDHRCAAQRRRLRLTSSRGAR